MDDATVRIVRDALERRGVSTFIDWQNLTAGLPWPEKLERSLLASRAVVVFVGSSGLGSWQTREIYFALDLQTRNASLPVIPVLLEGAEPPTGFLVLNTWVDLRGGVSDEALEPLLRAIAGAEGSRPPLLDVCPYRDLRAFREEDAALFFGRDDAIAELVQRVDATTRATDSLALVAAVGPSGSGKSSVVMAGVLPALRRQRPPKIVWDAVTFTPGDAPWRRLADALLPLLDAGLSEAARIAEGATLAAALQTEDGIDSAIQRVLKKSGGTDRLLMIVDQCEELFTLTDDATARAFVRALLAASRSVPMTVLLTLRSDYYGRAIALDRELSDALPSAQVNLGPIRREELRDVIEKPALLAGLSFESGLVERILDDVGEEPGNLPLLEYALTELWKARAGDRLTFHAYERIGRVAGALANRANDLYRELPDAQKAAARRLFLRLVRVSSADEEGADTRRRARRSEIDDEAWKLVPFFTSARARLLVAATDATTGQDTVEVAHEALIRKWDTLRTWLEAERRFLLWRQQLAVFRAKWIESPDDATLLRGPLLDEAKKWMRTRNTELSAEERAYIAASAGRVARTRNALRAVAAVVLLAMLGVGGWAAYQRTTHAVVARILARNLEHNVVGGETNNTTENLAALIRLGRLPQIEEQFSGLDSDLRPTRYADLAVAMTQVDPGSDPRPNVVRAAKAAEDGTQLVEVASTLIAGGLKEHAIPLLHKAEVSPSTDLQVLYEAWKQAGDVPHARAVLARIARNVDPGHPAAYARLAAELAELGDGDTALAFAERVPRDPDQWPEDRGGILRYLAVVEAVTKRPLLASLSTYFYEGTLNVTRANAEAALTTPDVDAWLVTWRIQRNGSAKADDAVGLFDLLVERRRFADAESVASDPAFPTNDLAEIIVPFVDAGELDIALRLVKRLRTDQGTIATINAQLSAALARAGRRDEADTVYEIARAAAATPEVRDDEASRDRVDVDLATALAARGRDYDAYKLAETIEADDIQRDAFLSILREIAARPH